MTTKVPEKDLPTPETPQKPKGKSSRPTFSALLAVLGILLVQAVLPTLLAGGAVWYLFFYFNVWQAVPSLAVILFCVAVVVVGLILGVLLDSLLAPIHRSFRQRHVRFNSSADARLAMMALSGLVIPIAVVVAANLVIVPPLNGTVMNRLINASQKPVVVAPPEVIGGMAMQTQNTSTKLLAIQVLAGFRSPEALDQLVRLASNDPLSLQDAGVNSALMKAIASYGVDAKAPLLSLFRSINAANPGQGGSAYGSDLYDRYFSNAFTSLQNEIRNSAADQAAKDSRLAQVQSAQQQLKTSLSDMDAGLATTDLSDTRLDFVMKTLLATSIKQDADLLTFAKTTAVDSHYSSQVRGDALLLIAQLGDKNDLDGLYPFLQVNDDLIQAKALQAIAALQNKVNQTAGNSGN